MKSSTKEKYGLLISKPFNSHPFLNFLYFIFGLTIGIVIWLNFKNVPPSLKLYILPSPRSLNWSTAVLLDVQKPFLMHSMTDQELLRRAAAVPEIQGGEKMTKVAFLFLARGALHFGPLWEKFFEGHQDLYSIYLHQHPEYFEHVREDSVFYRRRIPSQPVYWGTISMVDAERRLLATALLDQSNQRFVLLSESCIPLFEFTSVYTHLMGSTLSFLNIYDDRSWVGRGRYNNNMSPIINISDWRKGAQWFELHRDLATKVVSDTKYYPIFRRHCEGQCYSDEHYIPTLVQMHYGQLSANRSITYVDWSRGGPHPREFDWGDILDIEFLSHLKHGMNCIYNGSSTNMCSLFARKFHPNALEPLLRLAPLVLGFGH